MLKQDTTEAKSTVDGRLEYIEKEMSASPSQFSYIHPHRLTFHRSKRVEGQISIIEQKSEDKKMEVRGDVLQSEPMLSDS